MSVIGVEWRSLVYLNPLLILVWVVVLYIIIT